MFGSMDAVKRQQELQSFVSGEAKFLVVTDLCARGIDIPDVQVVLNYDFPSDLKTFVHRCGRTARVDRAGASYTLISREESMYMAKLADVLEHRQICNRFPTDPGKGHALKTPQRQAPKSGADEPDQKQDKPDQEPDSSGQIETERDPQQEQEPDQTVNGEPIV